MHGRPPPHARLEAECAPCSQGDARKRGRLPLCPALALSGLPCNMPLAPRHAFVGGVFVESEKKRALAQLLLSWNALDLLRPLLI